MNAVSDPVPQSHRDCRRIARNSGSNFYRSFRLLPPDKRRGMTALYAFSRVTDDLGDCESPASVRAANLDWWRRATALNLIGDADDPIRWPDELGDAPEVLGDGRDRLRRHAAEVLPALRETARRFDVPPRYPLEIIDGVIADQTKTRFDTYEQVEHYCYLVASAVGLACLHIWGFDQPMPEDAAIDCGVAFQWTNILRDVREDAARGRIYLPRQLYERHGLTEDDFVQNRGDDRLRVLIRQEADRAEGLYQSGRRVHASLHPDGRPMFAMMWRTYHRLLGRIAADPAAVMRGRVRLSVWDKTALAWEHWRGEF